MADRFNRVRADLTAPLTSSEVADVSSSDHEFRNVTREILVTTNGNLTIRLIDDSADLTLAVSAGLRLPVRVSHVRRSSTAGVVGFW